MGALRDRMIRELQFRRFRPLTRKSYLGVVTRLAKHYGIAPDQLSAEQVQDYLVYLITERRLEWNTINVTAYLAGVQHAWAAGKLLFPDRLAPLTETATFTEFLRPVAAKDWVVYTQPPWAGPEQVLDYLSRYTHRVAISNHRLRQMEDGRVTFDYRDRRDRDRVKQLTLPAAEFIRRFLLHVVPQGFCRIRHYGFLGNRHKEERLARCRELLGQSGEAVPELPRDSCALLLHLTGIDVTRCPCCGAGRMVLVERLPGPGVPAPGGQATGWSSDSS